MPYQSLQAWGGPTIAGDLLCSRCQERPVSPSDSVLSNMELPQPLEMWSPTETLVPPGAPGPTQEQRVALVTVLQGCMGTLRQM